MNGLQVFLKQRKRQLPVVQDLDFSIGFGERVGIVGESGCGKSITALALMGLLPSSMSMEGSIRLASSRDKFDELSRLQESQLCKIRGKRIGMVFQEPMSALNPVQPIGHQVSESLLLHSHVSRHEAFRQASRMLERVGLPESRFPHSLYPHQLSGGQMQRVMIAMAMAVRPRLLVADEITTALDANLKNEIFDLVFSLIKESKTAVLLISHDLHLIKSYCDRIAVMEKGCIVEINKTKNIFTNPRATYTKNIIKTLFIVNDKEVYTNPKSDKPVIVIQNISKTYNVFGNPIRALNKINLNILSREVLGIIGQSGSGKSTLVKILLQVLHQDEGVIKMIDDFLFFFFIASAIILDVQQYEIK